jgi:hypothetical protein
MLRACGGVPLGLLALPVLLAAGCGGGGNGRHATPTASASATPSATSTVHIQPSSSPTATPAATATTAGPTPTVTCACTPTVTRTATVSPTPTVTPVPPAITYFGVASADDLIQTTDLVDGAGRPIFARPQGQGMMLVLEARRGTYRLADDAYDPLGGLPGAQFLVSRPLGDGSPAVCDYTPPLSGGVPGVDPPVFSDDPTVVDAINDLGCRVNDGAGSPTGRVSVNACTHDASFEFAFVDHSSNLQFCLPVAQAWAFPPGDTIVAARVRDLQDNVSAPREIVVRVAGNVPFNCDSGLGERAFTPARPGSAVLTNVQAGDVSVDPWLSDPIRLCASDDLGDGTHALALRADATIGIPLADGSTLCARLSAHGSDGSLDCSGGAAQDILAVQSEASPGRIDVSTGLGLPAGTGAASLHLPIAIRQLPIGSSTSECRQVTSFNLNFDGALTTATGVAEVVDANGTPVAQLSAVGVNFDCDAWRTGTQGTLVLPFPALGTERGSVAVALVLQE